MPPIAPSMWKQLGPNYANENEKNCPARLNASRSLISCRSISQQFAIVPLERGPNGF